MEKIKNSVRYSVQGAVCLLGLVIFAISCGGGGGLFGGISNVIGQAVRPIAGVVESNPIPLGRAPVELVDFAEEEVASSRVRRTTAVGETDENGNFNVPVPGGQQGVFLVVRKDGFEISGIVNPNGETVTKNLDGYSTLAAEAAFLAIQEGTLSPDDLTPERAANFEEAARQLVAANPGEIDLGNPAQVEAAARSIIAATNSGASAPETGSFDSLEVPEPTPAPTPVPTTRPSQQEDDDDDDSDGNNCIDGRVAACDDGTPFCRETECNGIQNCPDNSDESAERCSEDGGAACCIESSGCPSETGTSCPGECCCCPTDQVCDQVVFANGCVAAPPSATARESGSGNKLWLNIPFWD